MRLLFLPLLLLAAGWAGDEQFNGRWDISRKPGEIDGLTAIASDADKALPGPIVLQGDHRAIEFRIHK